MTTFPSSSISAIATSTQATFPVSPRAASPAPSADALSFEQLLGQLTSDAATTIKAGESAAINGIQGKASVQEVVDSVMSAERTLHTVIALRDKVVGAYQDISKMSI